jgi:hypothetical protein
VLGAGRLLFLENRAIVKMMVGVGRSGARVRCRVLYSSGEEGMINQEKETDRQGRRKSKVRGEVKRFTMVMRRRSGIKEIRLIRPANPLCLTKASSWLLPPDQLFRKDTFQKLRSSLGRVQPIRGQRRRRLLRFWLSLTSPPFPSQPPLKYVVCWFTG